MRVGSWREVLNLRLKRERQRNLVRRWQHVHSVPGLKRWSCVARKKIRHPHWENTQSQGRVVSVGCGQERMKTSLLGAGKLYYIGISLPVTKLPQLVENQSLLWDVQPTIQHSPQFQGLIALPLCSLKKGGKFKLGCPLVMNTNSLRFITWVGKPGNK